MTSYRIGHLAVLVAGLTLFAGRHALAAEPDAAKPLRWAPLFDGTDLDGWEIVLSGHERNDDPDKIVQLTDGSIHVYKDAPAGTEQPYGYLLSKQSYSNYRLRLQYRWGDKRFVPRHESLRDAGLLFHVSPQRSTHGIWPVSVECQIQEGDTGDLITVDTRCTSYVDPATAQDEYPTFRDPSQGGVEHPNDWYINAGETLDRLEEWNDVEIVVCGNKGAVYFVNGKLNQRLSNIETKPEESWIPLKEGKLALQIEGAEVFYKNVDVRPLTEEEASAALESPQASPPREADAPVSGETKTGLDAITVPPGFKVELVADSNLVQHPMMGCIDDRGRIFLSESDGVNRESVDQILSERPHRALMLEDQDGDGVYDKRSIFADGLILPNGAEWHDGALYICSAPYVWRYRDDDGDGRAEHQTRVAGFFNFDGMSSAFHGPVLGPDGRFYWSGGQHGWKLAKYPEEAPQSPSGVGGPDANLTQPWTSTAPGAFSCWPDGSDPEPLAYGGINNPVETAFTETGEVLGTVAVYDRIDNRRRDAVCHWIDGGVFNLSEKNYAGLVRTGEDLTPVSYRGHAAPAGIARYRSGAFGSEYRDNFFFAEFNMHKVYRLIVERDGATFRSRDEVFVSSSDPDSHFTDVFEDADGSLLIFDTGGWFRHGCPTSQIAKPTILGAIYRVSKIDAPTAADARGNDMLWEKLDAARLTALLDDPRFVVRDRAVAELGKRGDAAVPALHECLQQGSPQARLLGVWALTRMRSPAAMTEIRAALEDADWQVQLAATHAACVLRDSQAAEKLMLLLTHEQPALRREAATALGRLQAKPAVTPLLQSVKLDGGRFGEHAATLALIRIGDDAATLQGLQDTNPDVRRTALTALDQTDSPLLTREILAEALDSSDKRLAETAMTALSKRPAWADDFVKKIEQWLAEQDLSPEKQASLRGAIRALYQNGGVQQTVAQALADSNLPVATRLVLLDAAASVDGDDFPARWLDSIGRCLKSDEPDLAMHAVSVISERNLPGFETALVALAESDGHPEALRIAAASAVLQRLPDVSATIFRLLNQSWQSDAASLNRLAAAQALGKGRLSPDQLQTLAEALRAASPVELPFLLKCFEGNANQRIGTTLVASLREAPGTSSLHADQLFHVLSAYPESVQDLAAPVIASISVDDVDRGGRLQRTLAQLDGADSARGREVFFGQRASCSSCHRVGDQGGDVGPNLSEIGKIRSTRDLTEAVVFPSASFAREYEPYNVLTVDGLTHSGVVSRRTADAIYLRAADRNEIRIPQTDIEEMEVGRISIMPQGLDRILSDEELCDVIAYLSSLK